MPKLLFSRIRSYEFKDLIRTRKTLRSRNKQKKDIQCILTNINLDSNVTKDNFQGDYVAQPTLEQVLTNKRSFGAFSSFLRSEFSEENIEFWKECKDYRERTPLADLPSKAAEIWLAFLHPLAPREVNIDHNVREKIKRSIVSPGRCCFDEALSQVYWLMERDSFPRFLKAEDCQNVRQKNKDLW
ncbi:regulator of G-protein signaling 21 isoform X2 [Hypomesus transpacificus]|uniref:regulator of G-protein signaling 21 isoform X2 n=1 Tax=Hypomesus transpacificus TaxID=137520 RepID=UPI001F087D9F|nr:regulator of G-protein signaling 21 isoform X2 [Hypomesus transpacificus]